jgi:hypothetical protein
MRDDQVFPLRRRPELPCLVKRNVIPASHALLQRKIVGCILVRRQLHSRPRISAETNGPDLKALISCRQVGDPILPMATGKNNHRDPGLSVLGLDERTLERRTVGTFHRSCNRRCRTHRAEQSRET